MRSKRFWIHWLLLASMANLPALVFADSIPENGGDSIFSAQLVPTPAIGNSTTITGGTSGDAMLISSGVVTTTGGARQQVSLAGGMPNGLFTLATAPSNFTQDDATARQYSDATFTTELFFDDDDGPGLYPEFSSGEVNINADGTIHLEFGEFGDDEEITYGYDVLDVTQATRVNDFFRVEGLAPGSNFTVDLVSDGSSYGFFDGLTTLYNTAGVEIGAADDSTLGAVPNRYFAAGADAAAIAVPDDGVVIVEIGPFGAVGGTYEVLIAGETFTDPLLTLGIDQTSGEITLSNDTASTVPIRGYSILSDGEALNPANWTLIADGGDADSGGSIDPDDLWVEFTDPDSHGDLSEGSLGEGEFEPGEIFSLGVGAWIQYYRQDLEFQYLDTDGNVVHNGIVEYLGNGGEPFDLGDLNFDGALDGDDWQIYVSGLFESFPELSLAEAYALGDLTGDLVNNHADFLAFQAAFDLVNGPGAFDRMISVPEPSSGLLLVMGILLVSRRRRRDRSLLTKDRRGSMPSVRCQVCSLAVLSVIGFISIGSAGQACAQITDNLIYYLPLDANAVDQSGNNVPTTINNTVTFNGVGIVGNAGGIFNAEGVTTATANYIHTNSELTLGTSDFSVSVWVNGDSTFSVNETDGTIISNKDWNSGSLVGWVIARGTAGGGGGWQWNFDTDAAGRVDFDPSPAISLIEDSQWHHIAVTHDRDGDATFYYDGQSIGSADISAHASGSINAGLPTGVGVDGALGNPYDAFINGSVDEAAIWDRVVSAGEIGEIYEAGLAGVGIPDVPGPMVLRVNTTTGATSMVREHPALLVDINFYEINSPGGSLDADQWNSFDEQNLDPVGTGPGETWDEGGGSNSFVIGEAFLLGHSTFGTHTLGNAYDETVNAQDLTFSYGKTDGLLVEGVVEYVMGGPLCDFDGSGACDIDDIDALVAEIVDGTNDPTFDLTGDGVVTLADIDDPSLGWLRLAGEENLGAGKSYLPADITLDGIADGLDFIDWNSNKFQDTGLWSLGDLNADSVTDGLDFIIWNGVKFTSSDGQVAVPEPTGWLWVFWLFVLARPGLSRSWRQRG